MRAWTSGANAASPMNELTDDSSVAMYPDGYDHKNEGYYVLMHFKADAAFPAELHRVMGITDGILRCLVTRR